MSENAVYVDNNSIANACLDLIENHRNRDYTFLSKLADFIADDHYYINHGKTYLIVTALSKKRIKRILEDAQIPYTEFHTKWHLYQRTAFITF